MKYKKLELQDGQLVEASSKAIDQSKLTSDCLSIQLDGLSACVGCEDKGTDECGGGETLVKAVK